MHQIRQRTQTNTRPDFTCGGLSSEEMIKIHEVIEQPEECIFCTNITKCASFETGYPVCEFCAAAFDEEDIK
jgi:hypothetical protein